MAATARTAPAIDNTILFTQAAHTAPAQIVLTPDQLQSMISAAVTAALKAQASPLPAAKAKPAAQHTARTDSPYKTNGIAKATPADPIRSPDDFQALANHLLTTGQAPYRVRNYTLLILGTTLGLRCGDLLRITLEDVFDFSKDPLAVRSHLTLIEEKTGKRNVNKITPMAKAALELYARTYSTNDERKPLFFSKKRDARGHLQPMDITQAWRILNGAGKAAGLDAHLSTHSMRKTYGYTAHAAAAANGTAGETLETLQLKFKHRDQRVTMIYSGIGQDAVDNMAVSVDQALMPTTAEI